MSRSPGSASRSGDPRKRAVPAARPDTAARKLRVVFAVIVAGALVAIALVALRPADGETDEEARTHAVAACDLVSKADTAVQVDTPARYAAAALLLDKAIVESARAAEASTEFAALDQAVQAVHTAAHRGSGQPWRDALEQALTICHEAND